MAATRVPVPADAVTEMRAMLRELQGEMLLLALPALFLLGFPLVVIAPRLADPTRAIDPGLVAFWLAVAVWAVRGRSRLVAAWLLVLGSIGLDLLVMHHLGLAAAVSLLALPAGLAALFISLPGGLLTAAGCTLLLASAPPALMPASGDLRAMALIGIWGTVGLIWLTLRPLVTALEWLWSSYQQNRDLLVQARDQRLQLKEALQDLAEAKAQLTRRLSRAAHAPQHGHRL